MKLSYHFIIIFILFFKIICQENITDNVINSENTSEIEKNSNEDNNNDEGNSNEGNSDEDNSEEGNRDEDNSDEDNSEEGNSDEGSSEEGNSEEENSDEVNSDEQNSDEVNSDEQNSDEVNSDESNGDNNNGKEWQSECEQTKNPSSFENCLKKSTEFIYERCCYLLGTTKDGIKESECVDIIKDDSINSVLLNQTRNLIMNGTYWESYPQTYIEIETLRCFSKYIYPKYFLIFINILITFIF